MKKTKIRKISKIPISKIQRQIWEECRRIKNIGKSAGVCCYTCGKRDLQGSDKQLGHMWAKASLGANLKYELDILEWQCTRCNIWGGGMGADFYKRKLKEIGEVRMRELERMRNKSVKAYDFYVDLLIEYKNIK